MVTLISTQPAAGSAVTFSGIPNSYQDLILDIAGVSHDNPATAQVRVEISADGAAWSPPVMIQQGAAALAYTSRITFAHYTDDIGAANRVQPGGTPPSFAASLANHGWHCPGGIQALRVSLSAGNFDAGSFSLSGR